VAPTVTCVVSAAQWNFSTSISTLLIIYHGQNNPYGDYFLTAGRRSSLRIFVKTIMGQIGDGLDAAAYLQPPFDNRLLVKWLENQSEEIQSK
jgi:hypothetical protein